MAELSPELQHVFKGLDEANRGLESVRADVEYESVMQVWDDAETSMGEMSFLKPNLLHLKLGGPRNEEAYCDGEHWWIITHEDEQVEKYAVSTDEEAPAEAAFLTFGLGQDSSKLLEEYEVTLKEKIEPQEPEDPVRYRLRFLPRDKEAPARFSAVEVELAEGIWLPQTLVLEESDGEILQTFRFVNMEINPDLGPEDFTCDVPRGYTIIEPDA